MRYTLSSHLLVGNIHWTGDRKQLEKSSSTLRRSRSPRLMLERLISDVDPRFLQLSIPMTNKHVLINAKWTKFNSNQSNLTKIEKFWTWNLKISISRHRLSSVSRRDPKRWVLYPAGVGNFQIIISKFRFLETFSVSRLFLWFLCFINV